MSCRRNSPIGFHGSPESAAGRGGSFISVQYYQNISASDTNGPNSASPKYVAICIVQMPDLFCLSFGHFFPSTIDDKNPVAV